MHYTKFLFLACLISGVILSTSCSSVAKIKFIEINIDKNIATGPVALDNNRIFYAGGNYNQNKYMTAKIYDFDKNNMYDTNVVMNVPRNNYQTVKLNDFDILILGGYCSDTKRGIKNCGKIAEIYNLKENKFYKINDSKLNYNLNTNFHKLADGNVIVISGNNVEIFDIKKLQFTEQIQPINDYFESNIIELNPKEILIYGKTRITAMPAMEVYNTETKTSSNIIIPKDIIYTENPIKIDSNTVLFVGISEDKQDIVKFDIQNKKFTYSGKLSSALAGISVILDDSKMLFYNGILDYSDLWRDKSLVYAIYDYKKNKILDKKVIKGSVYEAKLIKLKNYIYVESKDDFLFRYTN